MIALQDELIFGSCNTLNWPPQAVKSQGSIFRWFKFILKPPYTIAIGNL